MRRIKETTPEQHRFWRDSIYAEIGQWTRQTQGKLTVERMCELATVSRAGYYRRLVDQEPQEEELATRAAIQEIFVHNEDAGGHGLAVTGGAVSTTGIAGYTLGGGLGWLMGKYGLACDNLEAVELVTAAGEVLQVDADSHPDLLWALRGGGGNFGVVTAFTYRMHPLSMVTGGLIAHPIDAARISCASIATPWPASDDLTVFAGLVHAPDGSGPSSRLCRLPRRRSGHRRARARAPCVVWIAPDDTGGADALPTMNTLLDAGYPTGSLNYWLSSFTGGLPDALIDAALERFASVPSTMTAILFEHFHGAVTRVAPTDTAVPHREPAGTS